MPAYQSLSKSGQLGEKVCYSYEILRECRLCPRNCGVNRILGERGYCGATAVCRISSVGPHFGEEPELVGKYGSGTIFFCYCNLRCCFCQNYEISHLAQGIDVTEEELAHYMLALQRQGCHNINLVTPTHYVPQILKAIDIAATLGLNIPIVYNSSGYESIQTLKLLEGVIDIYMPDMKYSESKVAEKYSSAPDYPQVSMKAVKVMHEQVGDLIVEGGIAKRGLIIRHLVLPYGLAGTFQIMQFIAKEISPNTYVNVMSQYCPQYRAFDFPMLSRRITYEEYNEALNCAFSAGLLRVKRQNR